MWKGESPNLHFASQCTFCDFLVTGHKKEAGMGDAGDAKVLYNMALSILRTRSNNFARLVYHYSYLLTQAAGLQPHYLED
jgi:hypothetical protein